jgi:hypothetical protein
LQETAGCRTTGTAENRAFMGFPKNFNIFIIVYKKEYIAPVESDEL